MSEWVFFNPSSRGNVSSVLNRTADEFVGLISQPETWNAPTASGHWEVCDIAGHLVDTTEGYFVSFDAARGLCPAPEAKGLVGMDGHVDAGARRFRQHSQSEVLDRLAGHRKRITDTFETLTDDEWAGLMVPHGFMGPLPACFYPVFQLVDYAIHSWDIKQGTGRAHALPADTADLLVPVAFVLWNYTVNITPDIVGLDVAVTVSGRNAGTSRIKVGAEGVTVEPGSAEGAQAELSFDPASFVLTAFGRMNAGSASGDLAAADKFLNAIFRV